MMTRRKRAGSLPPDTRFPPPAWESELPAASAASWRIGDGVQVERVPAGIWLRVGTAPAERTNAAFAIPQQDDVLFVVAGAPGEPEPPVAAVGALLTSLPAAVVPMVQLVTCSPSGDEEPLAQRVADALNWSILACTGHPVAAPGGGVEVVAIGDGGAATWRPFVTEICHWPGKAVAELARWTAPAPELVQLRRGVYRLTDNVIIEVVPAGVWIREDSDHEGGAAVRRAPLEPSCLRVAVGSAGGDLSQSLSSAVDGYLAGLEPEVRDLVRVDVLARSVDVPDARADRPPVIPAASDVPEPAEPSRPPVTADERREPATDAEAERVPPGHRSTDQERDWMRRTLGTRFDAYASGVQRLLHRQPGLCANEADRVDAVVVDLVAVKVYLEAAEHRADAALRAGRLGELRPYVHCVASGLRRLPSHRGPVWVGAPADAEPPGHQPGAVLVERGLLSALAGPVVPAGSGNDFLIWSVTGRRVCGLDDDAGAGGERVVFPPGCAFKVVGRLAGPGVDGATTLLREVVGSSADDRTLTARDLVIAERLAGVAREGAAVSGGRRAVPPGGDLARFRCAIGQI